MSLSYVQVKYFKELSAKSQTEAFLKITAGDAIIIATKTEYASKLFSVVRFQYLLVNCINSCNTIFNFR